MDPQVHRLLVGLIQIYEDALKMKSIPLYVREALTNEVAYMKARLQEYEDDK